MTRAQRSNDGETLPFGLGWIVRPAGRTSYSEHGGGGPGIESLLRVYPKKHTSIAVLGSVIGYGASTIIDYTLALIE
jgi:CubicO group peptidase (beta-lactamase class C family)